MWDKDQSLQELDAAAKKGGKSRRVHRHRHRHHR